MSWYFLRILYLFIFSFNWENPYPIITIITHFDLKLRGFQFRWLIFETFRTLIRSTLLWLGACHNSTQDDTVYGSVLSVFEDQLSRKLLTRSNHFQDSKSVQLSFEPVVTNGNKSHFLTIKHQKSVETNLLINRTLTRQNVTVYHFENNCFSL